MDSKVFADMMCKFFTEMAARVPADDTGEVGAREEDRQVVRRFREKCANHEARGSSRLVAGTHWGYRFHELRAVEGGVNGSVRAATEGERSDGSVSRP